MEELNSKDFNPESLVDIAIKDPKIIGTLISNLEVKDDTIRYNSHKVLLNVSLNHPEVLYPHWDSFAELIKSKNNFHKVIGIQILANLVRIDIKNKLDDIFDILIALIDAKSVMTAAHLAANLGKIAKRKPDLRKRITDVLLNIDKTHHESDRKDLIKASVIESFNEYFNEIENKEEIIKFVETQLTSKSPKTRKVAEKFLKL
ncbi:MAG: hypothetical protein ACFE8G_12810 [Candidatus Hermodarchaeota archaeon]